LPATLRLKSEVPEPGAAIEAGVKLEVTPDGTPVAESATAELNPPETETVTTA
jgi:antitoxin (DNA-binding transcriptional repressor) of toxin-antitoxin stability system